jgi:hypothetical protein
MIKYLGIAVLIFFGSAGCSPPTDEQISVFLQKIDSKADGLHAGFAVPKTKKIDTGAIPEHMRNFVFEAREGENANILVKKIGDTSISYRFDGSDPIVESIAVPLKNADTLQFISLLATLGFERKSADASGQSIFVNEKAGITYKMRVTSRYIEFGREFRESSNLSAMIKKIFLPLSCVLTFAACSQTPPKHSLSQQLDGLLTAYRDSAGLCGSVLIAYNGAILHLRRLQLHKRPGLYEYPVHPADRSR